MLRIFPLETFRDKLVLCVRVGMIAIKVSETENLTQWRAVIPPVISGFSIFGFELSEVFLLFVNEVKYQCSEFVLILLE